MLKRLEFRRLMHRRQRFSRSAPLESKDRASDFRVHVRATPNFLLSRTGRVPGQDVVFNEQLELAPRRVTF